MTRTALFLKHRPVALGIAKGFYLPGSTEEDVRQEAMAGLWEATGTWDSEKSTFRTYASSVVRKHLTQCLRKATNIRSMYLTNAMREVQLEGGTVDATELIGDTTGEPHRRLVGLETLRKMGTTQMSPVERQVLLAILQGITYEELTVEMHCDKKFVDNAYQRAKKKVMAAA